MKKFSEITLNIDKIVGGGQALGSTEDGKKAFVWGALPGETVKATVTKSKSKFVEAVTSEVITASDQRVEPRDPDSFLSTSPWQIMNPDNEQHYKSALIEEAFELHDIVLPGSIEMYTDGVEYGYRNKVEFSWWWDNDRNELDLAFFRRGTQGKIAVTGTSLARPEINALATAMRDLLRTKGLEARSLKTLMIRCNQSGDCIWQLYVKDKLRDVISPEDAEKLPAQGGEVIYSDPKSPASRITKRLASFGDITLTDTIREVPFSYACEGFFQVNIPVYEHALNEMAQWINPGPVIDLYSGVGTIGLTIGNDDVTLVEINEDAVREMRRNITALEREKTAQAILAPSEKALDLIRSDATVILDPPRAGLHADVVAKLLEAAPARIIYLSCNPVTQARDVALLAEKYGIRAHTGYNFFPKTPHIEHLVVLDLK